jgi:hypothetical protein
VHPQNRGKFWPATATAILHVELKVQENFNKRDKKKRTDNLHA